MDLTLAVSISIPTGTIIYENKMKLSVENVLTDSESENEGEPSSTIVKPFTNGDCILVKLGICKDLSKHKWTCRYPSLKKMFY